MGEANGPTNGTPREYKPLTLAEARERTSVEGLPFDAYADYDEPTTSRITGLPAFDTTEANRGRHCTCLPVYERGFVASVALPTALFLGEPCGRCGGRGRTYSPQPDAFDDECEACHGTGRTQGVAAAVFAHHPITSVWLTDVVPFGIPGQRYHWQNLDGEAGIPGAPDMLPGVIFDLLDGWSDSPFPGLVRWYAGRDQAGAAASRACATFGRRLADLPPLPAPGPRP